MAPGRSLIEELAHAVVRGREMDHGPADRKADGSLRSCATEFARMWDRLDRSSMVILIGPPGVGKTSMLQNDLRRARPVGWDAVYCAPGRRPFNDLASVMTRRVATQPAALASFLTLEDPAASLAGFSAWSERHPGVLLMVDQLERVFLTGRLETQARFASLIGRLTVEAGVHVLLAMGDRHVTGCHVLEPRPASLPSIAQEAALLSSILAAPARAFQWSTDADPTP